MKKIIQNENIELLNNKKDDKDNNQESKNESESNKSKEKKTKPKKLKKEDNKKEGKKQDDDQIDIIIESKYVSFNLDFIYRREKYTLKNLYSNFLISKIKKLISKKLSIDIPSIHIYYLDKEIINDRLNVYDLIKDNKIKYFLVKKESPVNGEVISLNTNVNLLYKIKCFEIHDYQDFVEKIEAFFIDRCLDKHYTCEPFNENAYEVSFSCEDICFQFKRYMQTLKRIDKNYLNTKCELIPIDKSNIKKYKNDNNNSINSMENKYKESEFINKGPYMTYEEMQRKNEKEEKKKWIDKKGFII